MVEVEGFATQIFDWVKIIITKLTEFMLWIAQPLADKLSIEVKTTQLILFLGLSLFIASKITQDRGIKLVVIAIVIFAIFLNFGGGL